jgi:hypothetical protein
VYVPTYSVHIYLASWVPAVGSPHSSGPEHANALPSPPPGPSETSLLLHILTSAQRLPAYSLIPPFGCQLRSMVMGLIDILFTIPYLSLSIKPASLMKPYSASGRSLRLFPRKLNFCLCYSKQSWSTRVVYHKLKSEGSVVVHSDLSDMLA